MRNSLPLDNACGALLDLYWLQLGLNHKTYIKSAKKVEEYELKISTTEAPWLRPNEDDSHADIARAELLNLANIAREKSRELCVAAVRGDFQFGAKYTGLAGSYVSDSELNGLLSAAYPEVLLLLKLLSCIIELVQFTILCLCSQLNYFGETGPGLVDGGAVADCLEEVAARVRSAMILILRLAGPRPPASVSFNGPNSTFTAMLANIASGSLASSHQRVRGTDGRRSISRKVSLRPAKTSGTRRSSLSSNGEGRRPSLRNTPTAIEQLPVLEELRAFIHAALGHGDAVCPATDMNSRSWTIDADALDEYLVMFALSSLGQVSLCDLVGDFLLATRPG